MVLITAARLRRCVRWIGDERWFWNSAVCVGWVSSLRDGGGLSLRVAGDRLFVFFFKAEDGIRDSSVIGVQTCALPICRITKFGLLVQRDVRRRKWRTTRHELVYFCSEHIENAEASRARVCLLVHDINSELHPLAVDVHSFDRSPFRDAMQVVLECSPCSISSRQLHLPRVFA